MPASAAALPYLAEMQKLKAAGLREVAGGGSNPKILNEIIRPYFKNWPDDSTIAWCGLGMAYVFKKSGLGKYIPIDPGWADNWTKLPFKSKDPFIGAVVVMPRYDSRGKLVGNHVTTVESFDKSSISCCGANQHDEVNTTKYSRTGKQKPKGYFAPYDPLIGPPKIAPGDPVMEKPPNPELIAAPPAAQPPAQPPPIADPEPPPSRAPTVGGDDGITLEDAKIIGGTVAVGGTTAQALVPHGAPPISVDAISAKQEALQQARDAAEGISLFQMLAEGIVGIGHLLAAYPIILGIIFGGAATYGISVYRRRAKAT